MDGFWYMNKRSTLIIAKLISPTEMILTCQSLMNFVDRMYR